MKIVRGKKEIELTSEELRQAYGEQNKLFRKEDIKREFAISYLNADDAEDADAWVEGEDYNIDYSNVQENIAQQIRENFDTFIEDVYIFFAYSFDANHSENTQIENAIEEVISRMS